MGLKSGEYGGRYNNLQPTYSINSFVRFDWWKEALSMTTTCPDRSSGSRHVSNHPLNRLASV
jgi:hypothetical protein